MNIFLACDKNKTFKFQWLLGCIYLFCFCTNWIDLQFMFYHLPFFRFEIDVILLISYGIFWVVSLSKIFGELLFSFENSVDSSTRNKVILIHCSSIIVFLMSDDTCSNVYIMVKTYSAVSTYNNDDKAFLKYVSRRLLSCQKNASSNNTRFLVLKYGQSSHFMGLWKNCEHSSIRFITIAINLLITHL